VQAAGDVFKEINAVFISKGVDSDKLVCSLTKQISSIPTEKLEILVGRLHCIRNALPSLFSDDYSQIAMSLTEIIASVSEILPLSNNILDNICSFILKIIDYQFEPEKGVMGCKIKHIFECPFDKDLTKKSSGFHRLFSDIYACLHSAINSLEHSRTPV